MALTKGTRLGPYEILALHGVGGMGEVYRARDSRLDRIVAIKVLSGELVTDPGFRARFEREARSVAALSHPNICAVHDVGEVTNAGGEATPFLVMEYLEGETLAERLTRGALPLDEALDHAIEIGGALDRAHRQGIVHRDVKPANIMLTKSGTAKLLDFGLAKKDDGVAAVRGSNSSAPTALPDMTEHGTILGTFQYMAPEQVEGRRADARTDVFALGAVLYEMVTGKKAFEGKSQASLIAAILEREPAPLSLYQAASPPALDGVIKRCLAKDPDERWQSAGDLAAALRFLRGAGSGVLAANGRSETAVVGRKSRASIPLVAALASTVALGALLGYRVWLTPESELVRFEISPPPNTVFGTTRINFADGAGVISPDGRTLAFTATAEDGTTLLWLRPLETSAARPLAGTEGAALPFWSPDNRWIGFFAAGNLRKVPAAGGGAENLAEAPMGRGGTWSADGTIVFSPDIATGLWRVGANGGAATVLTTLGTDETSHRFPSFLPDGRRFLYVATGNVENSGIHVGALDSNTSPPRLIAGDAAIYAHSGHVLFVRQNTSFAQRFDTSALALVGDAVRIADSTSSAVAGVPPFSVSGSGVLTYQTGVGYGDQQFAWFDRGGQLLETVGPPGQYRGVDLSPDGTRIAVHRHDGNGGDVWIFEPRGTMRRLTFEPTYDNSMPIWSPDGNSIVFGSQRNGQWGLYRKPSNGTGNEELLLESEALKTPMEWTPDSILYMTGGAGREVLRLLPLNDDGETVALLDSRSVKTHPQVSPNGRWVAYAFGDSGQAEVWVARFPSGEERLQISTSGGLSPRWREDGQEVFFLSGGDVIAVTLNDTGSTLELSAPQRLFASGDSIVGHNGGAYHRYAVSLDGQRFLIPRPVASLRGEPTPTPITVVLNWTRLLERDRP